MIKLGSLFDGIGVFLLCAEEEEIIPVWASEIEPFPITVTKRHFPQTKHLGDITKINGAEIEPVDIITFGSPCFPAGTLVLTEFGYKPIEEINVGEKVLTHTGKWQKVLRVGNKISDTVILKGFGHYGIEATPEHPFYASEKKRRWTPRPSHRAYSTMTEPTWIQAQKMKGKFWAAPINAEALPIPSIVPRKHKGKAATIPEFDNNFWWFVGRWLGDGWVRNGERIGRPGGWGQIFLCCAHQESDMVNEHLSKLGLKWAKFSERTVIKFRTTNQAITLWLIENFGQHAHAKKVPPWALGLCQDHRQAILDGYFSADGWKHPDGSYSATTVSKTLALGIRLIAESLGYASPLYYSKVSHNTTIEGRIVNQRSQYTIRYSRNHGRTSRTEAYGHSWGLVRTVSGGRRSIQVYNLEVEHDNSYVIENIVVHNCQDVSVAGKRKGINFTGKYTPKKSVRLIKKKSHEFDGFRRYFINTRSALFLEAVRIIWEMRLATDGSYPRFAIWENVHGALSSNNGRDFRTVLEKLLETEVPVPKSSKLIKTKSGTEQKLIWANAGLVRGDGRSLAWRVLDAQYWGVPQRRRRIFLVTDFGGQCAGEILFESQSMSRDSQEGREAREEVAATFKASTNGAGRINRQEI